MPQDDLEALLPIYPLFEAGVTRSQQRDKPWTKAELHQLLDVVLTNLKVKGEE